MALVLKYFDIISGPYNFHKYIQILEILKRSLFKPLAAMESYLASIEVDHLLQNYGVIRPPMVVLYKFHLNVLLYFIFLLNVQIMESCTQNV